MQLAKSGEIQNVCTPNALLTLKEYLLDYGDAELQCMGENLIQQETAKIENQTVQQTLLNHLSHLNSGKRDLFF